MSGFIRKTEVVKNAAYILRTWGVQVFVACILAKGGTPFLTILVKYNKM
jgi:hypothetical protein